MIEYTLWDGKKPTLELAPLACREVGKTGIRTYQQQQQVTTTYNATWCCDCGCMRNKLKTLWHSKSMHVHIGGLKLHNNSANVHFAPLACSEHWVFQLLISSPPRLCCVCLFLLPPLPPVGSAMAVLMPIRLPLESSSTPPELPGLMAASVCRHHEQTQLHLL